jgi:formate-dependent nitrite reductase cytochrome c552 subunit
MNPVENGSNMTNFDVMQMFFTGCYDDAARDGLDFIGATGAYTWQNTKAYQLITHGIGPAASADDCAKCHHGRNEFTPEFETSLDAIGYQLKDGDDNGVINDADRLIICSQCHQEKAFKKDWEQMHNHTAKGSGIGCYFCHEFQRPERNLCDACDPACVAEFVDTNPFPHQCP